MYARIRRFRLEFRVRFGLREWLFAGGIVLLFGGVSASFIQRSIAKSRRSDEAKEAYLAACRPAQGDAQCAAFLDRNHEECFFVNDIQGGKFNRGYFRREEYERCVPMGIDAWRAARQAERRAAEREREKLGLPR